MANYYRSITDKLMFLSANFWISVIITDKCLPKQQLHRQMTVDITHDCIWILNADKHLRFLQSKHLQCIVTHLKWIKGFRIQTCFTQTYAPLLHTANVLTVENTDVCLRSKSKYNHELYLQSFVCGAVVLASICV